MSSPGSVSGFTPHNGKNAVTVNEPVIFKPRLKNLIHILKVM